MNNNESSYKLIAKTVTKMALSEIPFVGSICNELIGYFDERKLNDRLNKIESKLNSQGVVLEKLQQILENLSEHDYYVLRNNMRTVITSIVPEMVDSYNNALIDYILNEPERDIIEEINEILGQLNKNDLMLLKELKNFTESNYEQKEKNKFYQEAKHASKGFWQDRNMIYGIHTIFVKDFQEYYFNKINIYLNTTNELSGIDDFLMTTICNRNDNRQYYDLAFQARSLYKLQSLGVISLNFISTLGTISFGNIDRIHITVFGRRIFKYIEINNNERINNK